MLPLAVLAAETRAPLAEAAKAVESARDAFRADAKPTPEQLVRLRFALEKAVKARSAALGRFHPGTLEAAGLWGAALQRTGEGDRGDRVWARACTELTRGLKLQERFHGASSKQLLPHLEALESCFEAQGLNARRYADRLLDIAVATSKGPRLDLERRAVTALRKAYGEFLVMRGPQVEATLHWTETLADLWLRRPEGEEASKAFLETAFRSDAQGVWKLCATKGSEGLRDNVAKLLERVDAGQLATDRTWPGNWAHPLLKTPWRALAKDLLARADRMLAARPGLGPRLQRVDLAEAEGAWERGAGLLRELLPEADGKAFARVANRSLDFLERHRDPALLRDLARAVAVRRNALGDDGEVARGLALALEAEGQWADAERLRRSALRPGEPSDQVWLARNLAGQGRFEEAAALFTAASSQDDGLDLGFEAAAAWRRAGRTEAADRVAKEALQLWAHSPRSRPRSGFAEALALVAGSPAEAELWTALVPRLQKELGLPEGVPLPPAPVLLQALGDEEAGQRGGPCEGGDPAAPSEARAQALLTRIALRDTDDEEGCLDAALKLLAKAWDPLDPRWIPWLRNAADRLKERAPDKAEGLLRRALEIATYPKAPEDRERLELRTLLGLHLLQHGQEEEGRKVLLDAFDKAAPGFHGTKEEMDIAGGLVLALLQGYEEDLAYDEALDLARRCQAVLDRVGTVPKEERKDLDKLLKDLEHQAKLQGLMGSAWPG
ncbi:MAG: hypothetical protein U0P81_05530 [Holophagaceae bacterium]